MRALALVVILAAAIAAPGDALAISKPPAWVCALVRQQLAAFGGNRIEAIKAARARGYSAADIARAKLCV